MPSRSPLPRTAHPKRRGLTSWTLRVLVTVLALLATALVSASPPAGAQAHTVYVAPWGNDGNPGTRSQPKGTIQGAMILLPNGGDILLRGGTYHINGGTAFLWMGGTRNRPLVVKSAPGERAELVAGAGHHCIATNQDYVRIRNLDCTGYAGIGIFGSSHVKVYGNYVHDLWGDRHQGIIANGGVRDITIRKNTVRRVPHTGIHVGDTRMNTARKIVVDDNVVRQANYQFRHNNPWAGGWGSGISVVGGDDVKVTRNDVRRTYGEGINCPLSNRCRVRRNVVVDAWNALFYADNSTNSKWEDNVAKTTGDPTFTRDYGWGPYQATGFAMANETGWFTGSANPVRNNIVRNNVMIDVNRGFSFGQIGTDAGMRNTLVANNTIVNADCGIDIAPSPNNSGNEVINNIVVRKRGAWNFCGSARGTRFRSNLWASGRRGAAAHSSDIRADPRFTVGTGRRVSNYRLQASSPAVDAGRSLSYVSDDRRGRGRPSGAAYDIGAYER